jgi:hypothetical protein
MTTDRLMRLIRRYFSDARGTSPARPHRAPVRFATRKRPGTSGTILAVPGAVEGRRQGRVKSRRRSRPAPLALFFSQKRSSFTGGRNDGTD